MDEATLEWEDISSSEDGGRITTERASVPGGWLYRCCVMGADRFGPTDAFTASIAFVPRVAPVLEQSADTSTTPTPPAPTDDNASL